MTDYDKAFHWYKRAIYDVLNTLVDEVEKQEARDDFKHLYGSYFDKNGKQIKELK